MQSALLSAADHSYVAYCHSYDIETIFKEDPFLAGGVRISADPLHVVDILHFAAPRQPRRLYVHVSRILDAAASDELIVSSRAGYIEDKNTMNEPPQLVVCLQM